MRKRLVMLVLSVLAFAAAPAAGPRVYDAPYPQCVPCPDGFR